MKGSLRKGEKKKLEELKEKEFHEMQSEVEGMREELKIKFKEVERFREVEAENDKNLKILESLFNQGIIDSEGSLKEE